MKRFLPIILLLSLLVCSCRTQQQIEPLHYQSMSQKGTVTLRLNQLEHTLFCTTQLWRNELIVLSLQPTLGLEMVRIEATNDSVTIVDKMNYRYTTLAYNWAPKQVTPTPSFELIQNFVTAPIQEQKKKKNQQNQVTFQLGASRIAIQCSFSQRGYDKLGTPRQMNLQKYKRVSLHEILPL